MNRFSLPVIAALVFGTGAALGQGSLAPFGPPAPTMKSLDHIEARTPTSSAPFTITVAGSYYLTGNVVANASDAGIVIAADDVTADLNGFALAGGGAGVSTTQRGNRIEANTCTANSAGPGFLIQGGRNLVIRNAARGNLANFNYSIGPQNTYRPLVLAPGTNSGNVNDNSMSARDGDIATTDPNANIVY